MKCWVCEGPSRRRSATIRGGGRSVVFCCERCRFHFFHRDNTGALKANQLDQTRLARAGLEIPPVDKDFENGLVQSVGYAKKFLSRRDRGGRVLEVGCSWGYFLEVARRRGADPRGVEINPIRSAYVNRRLGIPCRESLEAWESTGERYRKIFLFYALEYIQHPRRYLARLFRLLEPGGEIVLITPNLDDVLKDLWRNKGFSDFFYDEAAVAYYSARAVQRLVAPFRRWATVSVRTEQGYSVANHLSWHFTQKPRTTGIVGGDRYVDDIVDTLKKGRTRLGSSLADLIRTFDRNYRRCIERHQYGNRVIARLAKKRSSP